MTNDEGQATVNERRLVGAELSSSVPQGGFALVRHSSPDNTPPSAAADRQAFFILKKLGAAVREFDMIRDGDRIAVAVSGGKDSLGLLRLLQAYRRSAGVRFELAAIHVLGDATGVIALHPPLGEWLAGAGRAPAYRDARSGCGRRAAADMPTLHLAPPQGAFPGRGCAGLQRRRLCPSRGRRGADHAAQPALRRRCADAGALRRLFRRAFPLDPPADLCAGKRPGAFRPRQRLSATTASLPALGQLAAQARGRDAEGCWAATI